MAMTDAPGTDVSFRARLFGFDRQEVRAFIANILEDYGKVRSELERVRAEASAPAKPEDPAGLDVAARDVQRVLEGAHRVADDIERRAAEEGAHVVAQAQTEAAAIVASAERRAAEITEGASRELLRLEAQAATLQERGLRLRGAFEAAADTATAALRDMGASELGAVLSSSGAAKIAV
jgi:cell division septum initiation protein DivIVA